MFCKYWWDRSLQSDQDQYLLWLSARTGTVTTDDESLRSGRWKVVGVILDRLEVKLNVRLSLSTFWWPHSSSLEHDTITLSSQGQTERLFLHMRSVEMGSWFSGWQIRSEGPDLEFIFQLAESGVTSEAGGVLVTNYLLRTSLIASLQRFRNKMILQIRSVPSLICSHSSHGW